MDPIQPQIATLEKLPPGADSSNGTGKHGISRRAVLISLIGLSTTGLAGGGITWLAQQYMHSHAQKPPPKPTPTPTATPIPVGTTLFTYYGHSDTVNTVAWSPQDGGTYIASGGKDHSVHVWYSGSGSDAHTAYAGHSDMVNSVAWSPDGTLIASASNDKTVQVWKSADGSSPITYSNHTDAVNTAAWSPDQTMIASGSNDKTVRLWKASDGSDILSYSGHTDVVRALAWSPDGLYIASASADQTVQVWEAAIGKLLFTYKGWGAVHFFAQGRGGGRIEEKRAGEQESMKVKKNKRQPSRADATGERRTARRAGDDPVAQRAPQSDVGRDRSGGGRTDQPEALAADPGPRAAGGERGLE